MASSIPQVVVVGSLNLDYITSVERLPAPGETVAASGLIRRFGGKGANQAVAAARQGARVNLIGCLGEDDDGRAYLRRLRAEGIGTRGISRTTKASTGTALIAVDGKAENTIIVASGANGYLGTRAIEALQPLVTRASAILLQFEIPMSTNLAVIKLANRVGVPVVLNPSPLREGFPWGRCKLDTLIVNAGEAHAIFGLPPEDIGARRLAWTKALAECGVDCLIITRGAQPTICFGAGELLTVNTLKVKPVDSVGAGDAFAGTFLAHRAQGLDLVSAIRLANCAGALTTLKPGAQEAIPSRAQTQRAARALRASAGSLRTRRTGCKSFSVRYE
jgi:ribokinase